MAGSGATGVGCAGNTVSILASRSPEHVLNAIASTQMD